MFLKNKTLFLKLEDQKLQTMQLEGKCAEWEYFVGVAKISKRTKGVIKECIIAWQLCDSLRACFCV